MSTIASDPSLLRNLKALLDDGLITEEEHAAQKSNLLATAAVPSGSNETLSALKHVTEKASAVLESVANALAGQKRSRSDEDHTWLPEDQPSLFQMGARKIPKQKKQNKSAALKIAGFNLHKCPHCAFVTSKPGPLKTHIKAKHPKREKGTQSLFACLDPAALSERQKERAIEGDAPSP